MAQLAVVILEELESSTEAAQNIFKEILVLLFSIYICLQFVAVIGRYFFLGFMLY